MTLTVRPVAVPMRDTMTEGKDAALRQVSRELEATFLAEMLKHAGLGESPESFGGGVGEAQFASLLRNEQATAMAARGGIGLAEAIFNSLKETSDAR